MNDEINRKVIHTLNHLIEICLDGEKGFQNASEGLHNVELRALCLRTSEQRGQFARELQDEVRSLNGTPEMSGTVSGALHRGWIDLRTAVTAKDEEAIIAECERGEDIAYEAYEKALTDYLPPSVTGVVQRHYQQVRASHNQFSALQKSVR